MLHPHPCPDSLLTKSLLDNLASFFNKERTSCSGQRELSVLSKADFSFEGNKLVFLLYLFPGREWSDSPPLVCCLPASFISLCKSTHGHPIVYISALCMLVNARLPGKEGPVEGANKVGLWLGASQALCVGNSARLQELLLGSLGKELGGLP